MVLHLRDLLRQKRSLLQKPLTVALWVSLLSVACHPNAAPKVALRPVQKLELGRYMGTWYEIASMPNPFQRGCYDTQATYALTQDGTVKVRNSCHKGSLLGPLREVTGVAWRPNEAQQGALKVQFFWPFSGHYWVLALDEDYSVAVVGEPKRRYLWILARKPFIDEASFQKLVSRLPEWGYDATHLRKTVHSAWVTPKR